MAKLSRAQEDALNKLDNPKVVASYDDGSIDFMFEGQKLAMGKNGEVMTPAEYFKKVYKPWSAKKEKEEKKAPSWHYISKTPCEVKPELCEPRDVRHVAWDADDTIWEIKPYGIASSITGPLTLVDPDTVVEEHRPYKYKPKKEPAIQPKFEPYDEGLRLKYGYRYGHPYGYPEEAPEDFFLRQIDKEIGTEPPTETSLEVEKIMEELTEELSEKDKEFLGLTGKDVKLLPTGPATTLLPPPKEPEKVTAKSYEPKKTTIKLMPGYRDLLGNLKEQGVTNSIISLNTKGTVSRIIDKFGLTDHFLDIRDSWENKGKVFKEQMKEFGYKPQEAMFVDNTQSHVEDVAKLGAIPLVYGKDIKEVAQIVNYMTNA
jgi:phosphoglycolate phosphatase-like HAD superfamily hydrolase